MIVSDGLAGVTGVTLWWAAELVCSTTGVVAPLGVGVTEPNAPRPNARPATIAAPATALPSEMRTVRPLVEGAGAGVVGWLRVEVVVLMAAAPGFRWSRGVSPMAQDCSAAAVRTVDRAADAAADPRVHRSEDALI